MLIPIRFPPGLILTILFLLFYLLFAPSPTHQHFPKTSPQASIALPPFHLHSWSSNCQMLVLGQLGRLHGGGRFLEIGWILAGRMHTGRKVSQIRGTVLTKAQRERSPGCVMGTAVLIGNCLSRTGQILIFLCWLFRQELTSSPPCPLLAYEFILMLSVQNGLFL